MESARLAERGEGKWELILGAAEEEEPRRLPARLTVCSSAICACRDVTVAVARPEGELRFALDVLGEGWSPAPSEELPVADQHVAQAVADALDEAGWARLRAVFYDTKARALEGFDPTEVVAGFDFDEVELDGMMVSFQEVFPHAAEQQLELDGRTLELVEQYCVRPTCPCSDAIIDVYEVAPDGGEAEVLSLTLDCSRARWSLSDAPGRPLGAEANAVRRAILGARPRFVAEVAERRRLVRAVYLPSLQALRPELAPAAPKRSLEKPGRNAPCPCGSGQKYKRCCGR